MIYKMIIDYKDNAVYHRSFNELSQLAFGIDFEKWYQLGFWNDRYIPYSFIDGEQVISNVSVSIIDIISNGKKISAVQIGTVMTHPDYRRRGLAYKLMKEVL